MNKLFASNEIWLGGVHVGSVKLSTVILDYIPKPPDLTLTLVKDTGELFHVSNPEAYELRAGVIDRLLETLRSNDEYDVSTMTEIYVYLTS